MRLVFRGHKRGHGNASSVDMLEDTHAGCFCCQSRFVRVIICMEHVGNDRRDLRSSRRCIVPSGKVPEEVL